MNILFPLVLVLSIPLACNGLAQTERNASDASDALLRSHGVKTELPPFELPFSRPQTSPFLEEAASPARPEKAVDTGIYDEARRYAEGNGVEKDLDKATRLYSQALDAGDYRAAYGLYDLARSFQFGYGARKDPQHAKTIFNIYHKRCAESSDPWGMLALGMSYAHGVGTTPRYRTAISLLVKAIDNWQDAPSRKWVAQRLAVATGAMQIAQGGEQLAHPENVDWNLVYTAYSKAASFDDPLAEGWLGLLYENGYGVAKNLRYAVEWYARAAEHGDETAEWGLGKMYEQGAGVLQNYVEALKWYSLAAISGTIGAVQARDNLASRMSPRDISEAQRLAKRFLDEHNASSGGKPSKVAPNMPTVTGTGFFISEDGYLLTNHHVIAGASKIVVRTADEELPASLISVDASNDLALLKVSGKFTPLPLGNVHDVALGDSVMTIGFPNIQVQGLSPKLTRGEISSLSGAQDDPRIFQISVPVQPGNSGGALIDTAGNVIGVATAQLDALAALKISGSLPQNVNYAIKISYARLLVDTVPHLAEKLPPPRTDRPNSAETIDRATRATALILAWAKR